jgi:hypothetical protein
VADADPAAVAKKLPADVAAGLKAGTMTIGQALFAEALGLLDVWHVPGGRWCPCMTTLGREVAAILAESEETT